jgi:phosphoserine aminotransferase
MLAVEDQLDALSWANDIGGLTALIKRSESNLKAVSDWVAASNWVEFLAADPATISSTSICLKITDPTFASQDEAEQRAGIKKIVSLLEDEGVALDIGGYRDAPPGLRLWGGGTVESSDLAALTLWLDWAWSTVK